MDTFSPVAKMKSVRFLVSLATTYYWALHQLVIKNAFLNGILDEEVYMEQPLGFVAQKEYRCLQVEKVTLRSEIVSESLVWTLCINDSEVWSLSSRKRSLCVLADTRWEEDYACCVC